MTLLGALLLKLGSRGPYATGLAANGQTLLYLLAPAAITLALLARFAERLLYPILWILMYVLVTRFPASDAYELRLHPVFFGLLLLWAIALAGPKKELLLGRPWQTLLLQAYLAFVYFEGGWTKLTGNPGDWLSGESFRSYLALRYALSPNDLLLTLAGTPELCRLLSIIVLAFELGFPLVVFVFPRRLLQPWLLFGLTFQTTAHLLLGIKFLFPYLICFYLQAIDWTRLFPFLRSWRLVGGTAVIACLLTATTSRAEEPSARYSCLQEDERRIYGPKPNCEGTGLNDITLRSRSNSLGLRDRDFSSQASRGIVRILLLGSSNVFGESSTANVAKFFEQALNKQEAKPRFEVINGGVIGYSAVQSALLLPTLLEAYHPQVVIYDVALPATLLSTWFLDVESRGPTDGTAQTLAGFNLLWPLPRALSDRITNPNLRVRLITISRFVRVYSRLLAFEIRRFVTGKENELLRTYQNYLRQMKVDTERAGGRFHLSTMEVADNFFRQENAPFWLKPEWIAYHLLPAEPVSRAEVDAFWKSLASEFSLIDARPSLRGTKGGDKAPPQLHLDRDGLARQGENLSRAYRNGLVR